MTTLSWSTPADHTTDAGFRAWGSELSAKLQAAGLVQTADTGQINWTTVTRPGSVNNAAGYEIYRFDDALQATAPLYIKLEYGTGNVADRPCIWVSVGTGTNGAGTLTGSVSNRNTTSFFNTPGNDGVSRPSYLCVKDGFVGLAWKYGLSTSYSDLKFYLFFAVARTVDDSGAETGDGFTIFRRNQSTTATGGTQVESVSYSAGVQAAQNGYYAIVPGNVTASDVGTDKQIYKCYGVMPRVRPIMQCCVCFKDEFGVGTTFTATLVGTTARTYLSLGDGMNYAAANRNVRYCDAMLWE